MHKHVMLDLETMGSRPGSVIASIGAVRFNPLEVDAVDVKGAFYCNIDIDSQLAAGLVVDGSTIRWWLEQEKAAQASLFKPAPLPIGHVLQAFHSWMQTSGLMDPFLWSHGSNFDTVLLDAAYRLVQRTQPPWKYKNIRDTRTIFDLAGIVSEDWNAARAGATKMMGATQFVMHNALFDVVEQARVVRIAYSKLGIGGSK